MRCYIIDDEELARELLRIYCERVPNIEVIGEFTNVLDAQEALKTDTVDLLFLDIQMPNKTGIQFVNELESKTQIIFTTAYSEFAVEGFELNVTDYLLKPFSFDRFKKAIDKANDIEVEFKSKKDYVVIKSEHKVYRVNHSEISYIRSLREYVAFYYNENKIMSLGSLKQLELELPQNKFMRVHKSYIVSKDKVKGLDGNILYVGKEAIPLGPSFKESVLKELF